MEVQFNDLNADVDSGQAIEFLSTWFEPGDLVNITCMRAEKSGSGKDLNSQTHPVEEIIQALKEDPDCLKNIVWTPFTGIEWNVYVGVCTSKTQPKSMFKRGGKDNIAIIPGYWADIDCKAGGFANTDEAMEWVHSLAVKPTMIISSGTGLHVYWKFERSTIYNDSAGPEAWGNYLQAMAPEDIFLDKVYDESRVLKLPGCVRFAKSIEENNSLVRIIENTGLTYDQSHLRRFAEPFHQEQEKVVKRFRDKEESLIFRVEDHYFGEKEHFFSRILKQALMEEKVNDFYTWDEILMHPKVDWTITKEYRDGSRQWMRAGEGASERSAVTDFEHSPVMSLLSDSDQTNLSDLKYAGVPLTRYRVLLRLVYGDVVEDMLKDVMPELERRGAWK